MKFICVKIWKFADKDRKVRYINVYLHDPLNFRSVQLENVDKKIHKIRNQRKLKSEIREK